MTTEASGAPAAAAPTTTESSPTPGVSVDTVVVDPNAQPAAAPEGEGNPPQPAPADPRSPSSRISHYATKAREEREARLRAEGENEALRRLVAEGRQPAQPQAETPTQPTGPVEPDPFDRSKYPLGDIDPAYINDMIDYRTELKVSKTFETRDQQAKEAEASAALNGRIDVAAQASEAAGYPEGVTFLREAPVHIPAVREIVEDIVSTKNNGLVAAYFAKHVDQFKQVASLPVRERLRAIDNLDAELGARIATSPKTAPASPPAPVAAQPAPANAPAPTSTVNGRTTTVGFNPETATPAEWDAYARGVWSKGMQTARA